jgi:hypothetical protein
MEIRDRFKGEVPIAKQPKGRSLNAKKEVEAGLGS